MVALPGPLAIPISSTQSVRSGSEAKTIPILPSGEYLREGSMITTSRTAAAHQKSAGSSIGARSGELTASSRRFRHTARRTRRDEHHRPQRRGVKNRDQVPLQADQGHSRGPGGFPLAHPAGGRATSSVVGAPVPTGSGSTSTTLTMWAVMCMLNMAGMQRQT